MKKMSGKKMMAGADAKGGVLRTKVDTAGGHAQHMTARKVPLSKGQSAKGAMHDGPYGGKVKA